MPQDARQGIDVGRCRRCGGRIAATHMLMKTYAVDEDGRWRRQLEDFVEDVVVVCPMCGGEPAGHVEADGGTFAFVPADSSGEEPGSGGVV